MISMIAVGFVLVLASATQAMLPAPLQHFGVVESSTNGMTAV